MVREIVTGIMVCLALGAVFYTLMLLIAYKQICGQKGSPSEYYFDVPRKPVAPQTTILDPIFKWVRYAFVGLICLGLVFCFVWSYIHSSDAQLGTFLSGTKTIQSGLNILFPSTVAIVLSVATFKKPYYILFNIHDVMKQHQIYFRFTVAIIAWCLSVILQVLSYIFLFISVTDDIIVGIYCAIFVAQIYCFFFCLVVLINSLHICLSGQKSELKILDHLYYDVSLAEPYMRHIDPNNAENLGTISSYFIEHLKRKTKRAKGLLAEHIKLSRVDFWDATSESPLPRKRQVRIEIIHSVIWSALFSALPVSFLPTLLNEPKFSRFFSQCSPYIIILSAVVLGAVVILWVKLPALCQMRRSLVYGRWGYRFLDQNGRPRRYISRYPTWPTKMATWFRALLSLITLFRIERANRKRSSSSENSESAVHLKLLQKLYDTLCEIDEHNSAEQATFVLALSVCMRLELDAASDLQAERIKRMQEIVRQNYPHGELLNSWIEAILVDVQRDMKWYRKNEELNMSLSGQQQ